MGRHPSWVRIAVMAFLLLTAADFALCDVLFPAICELETSDNYGGADQAPSPDGCFCCCTHVVPVPACHVQPDPKVMRADPVLETHQAASVASYIFHPPRS